MRVLLSTPVGRRWFGRFLLALTWALILASMPSSSLQVSGGGVDALRLELSRLRIHVEEQGHENHRLRRKIAALKSDERAIEDAARDQLGWVYPGDVVVRIAGDEGISDESQ